MRERERGREERKDEIGVDIVADNDDKDSRIRPYDYYLSRAINNKEDYVGR